MIPTWQKKINDIRQVKEKIDKLVQVADSIQQGINAAVARWRNLPEQTLRFRPSEDDQ